MDAHKKISTLDDINIIRDKVQNENSKLGTEIKEKIMVCPRREVA